MSLQKEWEVNLKDKGVKLNFKEDSLAYRCLLVLYENLGQWVTKSDLVEIIGYQGNDLQTPRHLWNTHGWYVESNKKGGGNLAYRLVTVKEPSPNWVPVKRTQGLNVSDWESLKLEYDNCCASCGTKEGEPHRYFKRDVVLEKGHMDPRKDMSVGNIIPQCNYCNKHYGNDYVFDRLGRVIEKIEY